MEGWYSTRCNLSWKLKGTKSNRFYFQLQASTRRTDEIESGLLQGPKMIPTPTVWDGMGRATANTTTFENGRFVRTSQTTGMKFGATLGQAAATGLLPTPQAIDGSGKGRPLRPKPGRKDYEKMGNWRGDLKDFATQGMLPTPTCSAANGGGSAESLKKRGRGETNCLASWATLKTNGNNSQLNPLFVEEMMGFPENWIILPFLSGETNPSRPTETQ